MASDIYGKNKSQRSNKKDRGDKNFTLLKILPSIYTTSNPYPGFENHDKVQ